MSFPFANAFNNSICQGYEFYKLPKVAECSHTLAHNVEAFAMAWQ
jgi:hypothetical protein